MTYTRLVVHAGSVWRKCRCHARKAHGPAKHESQHHGCITTSPRYIHLEFLAPKRIHVQNTWNRRLKVNTIRKSESKCCSTRIPPLCVCSHPSFTTCILTRTAHIAMHRQLQVPWRSRLAPPHLRLPLYTLPIPLPESPVPPGHAF